MRKIDQLLSEYGESHQNSFNKSVHWICVPLIMLSLLGLLLSIPFPLVSKTVWTNWAGVIIVPALIYYFRLSKPMFIGFALVSMVMLCINWAVYLYTGMNNGSMALISFAIFFLAWIGQFYGHKVEGKKPSFLKDIQFLLVGPAWLLHFIFNRYNIKY